LITFQFIARWTAALEGTLTVQAAMRASSVLVLALVDVLALVVQSQGETSFTFDRSTALGGALSARGTTHHNGTTTATVLVEGLAQGTGALEGAGLVDALVGAATGEESRALVHIMAGPLVLAQLVAPFAGTGVRT